MFAESLNHNRCGGGWRTNFPLGARHILRSDLAGFAGYSIDLSAQFENAL